MSINRQIQEALAKLTFEQREQDFHHLTYDRDMHQYDLIKNGDERALLLGKELFEGKSTGKLSDDPVKNYQYLFIASITLACRFCIEGGMDGETAFNLSDIYIRRVDRCRTVQDIFDLHHTMFQDYITRMQSINRRNVYAQPVLNCMDYIDWHLQQPLTVQKLAHELELSPGYLSTLFKRETGIALAEYIRRKRIETAKTLLQFTDFSCIDIAEYLCFSSDSHFSNVFSKYAGISPTEYRRQNYRKHWGKNEMQIDR